MKDKYILFGIILFLAYIITSAMTKIFKKQSNGNSIKQEVSISIQNSSFLFEGFLCIFAIYLASNFKGKLIFPLFYILITLVILLVFMFLKNLIRCLKEYILYQKIGTNWYFIFVQFINTIVISYLVYNYYLIYIQ